MKIVLKVLIALLGLASIGIGVMLFAKNGKMAKEVAEIGNTFGLLPSEIAFKNGAIAAIIASLGTFVLIVFSFLKNPKTIVIVALASLGIMAGSYFLQPDYNAGLTGGANSKDIALTQLGAGAVACGLAFLLSRQKTRL
ncbi:MAG: hypothetical protein M0D57_10980 [Sphingobacteriales bacterium JAD_PAG50586_3]|nr:MAG: hypothetical protein M0D57_10980 [Sphingobacteriales bacterium JAD_PAG50586_3]